MAQFRKYPASIIRSAQSFCRYARSLFAVGVALAAVQSTEALDTIRFERDDQTRSIAGRTLVKASDGGLLVEARDGVLWAIEPQEIISRDSSEEAYVPLGGDELAAALLAELPPGFQAHRTAHYVICYNTSRDYALWCGSLYERLYRAFINFWSRRGFDLYEPEHPLPVIIFAHSNQYAEFAQDDLGDAVSSVLAYYSLQTNRVVMHDLTGVEVVRSQQSGRNRSLSITALLSQPAAEPLVATIVHEATHQIAFNCGLHTRYTDVPLWLTEGLAIYFETPDLKSSRGWQAIGRVNHRRLSTFQRNLPGRSPDRLQRLLASDNLLRDTRSGPDAYADAWALTYYLLRTREKDYVAYLKRLAEKPRLVWDDEATRLAEFREHFGDLPTLDAHVREYVGRLR